MAVSFIFYTHRLWIVMQCHLLTWPFPSVIYLYHTWQCHLFSTQHLWTVMQCHLLSWPFPSVIYLYHTWQCHLFSTQRLWIVMQCHLLSWPFLDVIYLYHTYGRCHWTSWQCHLFSYTTPLNFNPMSFVVMNVPDCHLSLSHQGSFNEHHGNVIYFNC